MLLLNLPPTPVGRLAPADCQSLHDWHTLVTNTFGHNLLRNAAARHLTAGQARALLGGNYATYWTAPAGDTTATLDFTFATPQTFDVLLQENIAVGQRIEQFQLEYQGAGGAWRTAAAGTTVGYKRLLRFAPVTTRRLRLRIEAAQLTPTLAALGVYKQAALSRPSTH
ncbi:MAG: discoidin domain-containing protein [Janthinobacterium lividum]